MNLWVHDGSKDQTVNRMKYRELLKDSLDQIFEPDYKNMNLTRIKFTLLVEQINSPL